MILTSVSQLANPPETIISLVPSQTELLHYLGLEQETIGITKFCIHPTKWFRNKIRVGGTKTIDIQKITNLNPALVIANKEENIKEQVEELSENFNVWVTDINNLKDSYKMINDIGQLTNKLQQSDKLIFEIKNRFKKLDFSITIPVTYLIWKNPWMSVGGDTFINDMLNKAGFQNVFSSLLRYPEVSIEQIRNSGCKVLLLSSEPFPFKQKHIDELQQQLPGILIKLVDGELFSWYGSRLLHAPVYLKKLRNNIENGR